MRTVEAVCTVVPMEFPEGTVPGVYRFEFFKKLEAAPAVTVNSEINRCSVSLDAGEWMCIAQRLNGDGSGTLGDAASADFIVPSASTVVIGVVGGLTVSVSEQIKTVRSVSVKGA